MLLVLELLEPFVVESMLDEAGWEEKGVVDEGEMTNCVQARYSAGLLDEGTEGEDGEGRAGGEEGDDGRGKGKGREEWERGREGVVILNLVCPLSYP